jgi:dihydroorotate dehydrogenase electron transfer subunit
MLKDLRCQVISNQPKGGEHSGLWELVLTPLSDCFGQPAQALNSQSGQFVMVGLPPEEGFSFRRPMSIYWDDSDRGEFGIFYKVHGRGTKRMSQWQADDTVNILGPLGNTWVHCPPAETLLIGGGIGIAPLVNWQQAYDGDHQATLIYGVANKGHIGLNDTQHVHLCTDDGSMGFHGNVVDFLKHWLATNPTAIQHKTTALICGPMGMMRGCANHLSEAAPHITTYLSLEEHMPCGTGACTGCVVPLVNQPVPVKACQCGPIFNARQLDWQRLGTGKAFDAPVGGGC